ncbi:hypothetical protein ACTPOK_40285 [Streptomyces inhibens]|uniref:hypothetical protein n=1 Tax=Streptomyces inhibens TaxID=2293571 RepID=UPI00402A9655
MPSQGGTCTIGQKYGWGPGNYNHATIPSGGKAWVKMFNSVLPGFQQFAYFKATLPSRTKRASPTAGAYPR